MPRTRRPLFPQTKRRAVALGNRLRLARMRRGVSLADMAARVDASRMTVWRLEKGDLSVGLALLVRILSVLGLESDIEQIARDDQLGQRLQDLRLRSPRSKRKARPAT
jgi:transcriptional regulator with XRE-family HTH domain